MEEDITNEALSDGADITSSDSNVAVDDQAQQGNIAKVLSDTLGKKFESDEQALKAVKDTQSFINEASDFNKAVKDLAQIEGVSKQKAKEMLLGSIKNVQQQNSLDEISQVKREIEDIKFFKQHPEMEKHEGFLKEVRTESGKNFSQIMESSVFKSYLEKASNYDDQENKKSVLHSSSRLGRGTDKLTEARKAQEAGNQAEAAKNAVAAVIDAFDLRKS